MNSLTSACGIPLDVSTGSVSIGAAITLSWKVGKGIISTTIQSRSRRFKHGKRRQRWENFINLQKRRKQQWELQEGNTRGETERRLSKKARAGEWGGSNLVWRDYVESSFKSTLRLKVQRAPWGWGSLQCYQLNRWGSAPALPLHAAYGVCS